MTPRSESSFPALTDALRGRRKCSRLQGLLADPAFAGTGAQGELGEVVREITGRELSARVVGRDAARISLTDLFDEGAGLAGAISAQAKPGDTVLEYAGGIGQVAHAIAPRVARLVSVDPDPRVARFGSALVPEAEFTSLDALPAGETFDGAYAVGVFGRMEPEEWKPALDALHDRLEPGGWLLLNPPAPGPEFRALYEPRFQARRSPVRDGSMVLERRTGDAPAAPVAAGDRWAVQEASVVADVLDDEVVVVDLDSGAYYILEGSASVIWQMLAAGQSGPEIVATLSEWHPGHAAGMESAIADFTSQLAGEGLIVPASTEAQPGFDPSALRSGAEFKAPEMFRYTEMEALIQMDPIRDYDETGWPRRPAARTRRG